VPAGIARVLCTTLLCAKVQAQPGERAPALGPPRGEPVAVELEGDLDRIDLAGETAVVEILGVSARIDGWTLIRTPTATITIADLLGAPLPGRSQAGFLGGQTVLVGVAQHGVVLADELVVEPGEKLLAGPVTAAADGTISILGWPAVLCADPRMPGRATNELGFEIELATVKVGTLGVAGGYRGEDGVFYAYELQADGDIVGPSNQTSITRSRCTDGARLLVRGGSTDSDSTVTLFDDLTGKLLDEQGVVPRGDMPGFGSYRFDIEVSACPNRVRVVNSNGSQAVADIER